MRSTDGGKTWQDHRPGAQPERVMGEIAAHLTPAAVPMGAV